MIECKQFANNFIKNGYINQKRIVNLDFQYAHRFMNWKREAKRLHGHSGLLTIELEVKLTP